MNVQTATKMTTIFARTNTPNLIAAGFVLEKRKGSLSGEERLTLAWISDEIERRGGGIVDDEAFCELMDQGATYIEALLVTFPSLVK